MPLAPIGDTRVKRRSIRRQIEALPETAPEGRVIGEGDFALADYTSTGQKTIRRFESERLRFEWHCAHPEPRHGTRIFLRPWTER